MRFTGTIPLFLATAAFYSQCAAKANEEKALRVPIIPSRKDFTPIEEASLEKRETCADGSRCLFGVCCGDGCAPKCCAHDAGGVGCNLIERCQFSGNVFIGCCGNIIGGCTGEATRITVHTPYASTMFDTQATTTEATTTTATGTTGRYTRTTSTSTSTSSDTSSTESSSADESSSSRSSSAASRTTSATQTRSTSRSDNVDTREANDSVTSAAGTATSTFAQSGGEETSSGNVAPAVTRFAGLEFGAVAVGALLVL